MSGANSYFLIPNSVCDSYRGKTGKGLFALNRVITSKTAMSWSLQKKKQCIFVMYILSERSFFYICILSQSIVY